MALIFDETEITDVKVKDVNGDIIDVDELYTEDSEGTTLIWSRTP